MEEKENRQSGLLFSKGFIKFSAIFLVGIILLMAFLHWKKGDYRVEIKPDSSHTEQSE